jgi:hypothetical protein
MRPSSGPALAWSSSPGSLALHRQLAGAHSGVRGRLDPCPAPGRLVRYSPPESWAAFRAGSGPRRGLDGSAHARPRTDPRPTDRGAGALHAEDSPGEYLARTQRRARGTAAPPRRPLEPNTCSVYDPWRSGGQPPPRPWTTCPTRGDNSPASVDGTALDVDCGRIGETTTCCDATTRPTTTSCGFGVDDATRAAYRSGVARSPEQPNDTLPPAPSAGR